MKVCIASLCLIAVAGLALAEVTSGPKVGDKLEDFKVAGIVGLLENKEGSYIAERKDEPTVYAFVQGEHFGRPMARFLKVLDGKVKEANDKSVVAAVWLTEKPDMIKEYLPKVNMSLSFVNTSLGVFTGEKSGPNNWGVNVDAHITVVVAFKGKAAATLAFQSVNETDVEKVIAELKKLK
jgi:hypothetical protein